MCPPMPNAVVARNPGDGQKKGISLRPLHRMLRDSVFRWDGKVRVLCPLSSRNPPVVKSDPYLGSRGPTGSPGGPRSQPFLFAKTKP